MELWKDYIAGEIFEGSISEISISTNSVLIIDNSMWARSGL